MDKYIKVDWPESQEWAENSEVYLAESFSGPVAFVPEELYNQVEGQ